MVEEEKEMVFLVEEEDVFKVFEMADRSWLMMSSRCMNEQKDA